VVPDRTTDRDRAVVRRETQVKYCAGIAFSLVVLALALPISGQEGAPRPRVFETVRGGPSMEVSGHVLTGVQPKSVDVSPDGTRVVVCNFGFADHDNVFVYDALTLERVGVATFPGNAVETVFTRDSHTLYVSNFRRHVVEELDFESCLSATAAAPCALTPVREIATAHHPKFMALSPDERTLYAASWGEQVISVVDVETGAEVRRLRTERHPRGLVVRPDGTLLAAAFDGDVIHVFPEGASTESERWETCHLPRHLLLSPDASTLYVTCSMGSLGFYDSGTGRRFGVGWLARNPRTIDISTDGRWIASANFGSSDVTIVDTRDHLHRTHEVEGADQIVGVAIHPGEALRVYATSWNNAGLFVLTERGVDQQLTAHAGHL
jgi:YVTN family beta-propeller protein